MARPTVTNAQRIDRSADRADALAVSIRAACAASAAVPGLSDDDVCDCPEGYAEGATARECAHAERAAWHAVATLAGNIQRDARLLAGLGRGG